jgi:hypothetical protein
MDDTPDPADRLLRLGAQQLTGHQRRLFQARACLALCDGNPRRAERRFGWGRHTVAKGLRELHSGVPCPDSPGARGAPRSEDKDPQLAADIRAIVEPHTYADPELRSARRYSNLSAAEVLAALRDERGYRADDLPSERAMRDILNRLGYRLKRVQKGRPLKKTKETDAIFANVRAARQQAGDDPAALEISIDTKAKVAVGDYVRGGKMPDGPGGQRPEGLGP